MKEKNISNSFVFFATLLLSMKYIFYANFDKTTVNFETKSVKYIQKFRSKSIGYVIF